MTQILLCIKDVLTLLKLFRIQGSTPLCSLRCASTLCTPNDLPTNKNVSVVHLSACLYPSIDPPKFLSIRLPSTPSTMQQPILQPVHLSLTHTCPLQTPTNPPCHQPVLYILDFTTTGSFLDTLSTIF
jgi:hypothetical protein